MKTASESRAYRILTWHVHGNYLYYLSQCPHRFYVPVKPGRPEGYGGRCGTLPWPPNLVEVDAAAVRSLELDCILFQSRKNWIEDQHQLLSAGQQRLPRIFLEHDPPRQSPTDTRHVVDDPGVLLIHCTNFNNLMWDSGRTPARVIEHGVMVPENSCYTGRLARGIAVVNGLRRRGRRLGADVFEYCQRRVPIDLAGIDSIDFNGLGEIPWHRLAHVASEYRFFFNPIRYTSLGLAVCEAMMAGLPVLGLATTELSTVVENGVSGFVETDVDRLICHMRRLLEDPLEAFALSAGARRTALDRFHIHRFQRDWEDAFSTVIGSSPAVHNGTVSAGRQGATE